MDKMTPEQRHLCMAAIHSSDTKPEMLVRRFLFSHGFRYRLNHKRLPGKPDIVLFRYRTVIFVNGCFWHGHTGCRYYALPHTHTDFWRKKIERNQQRDKQVRQELSNMGWHCITIWECELKPKMRRQTLASLLVTLSHLFVADRCIHTYAPSQSALPQVAEDEPTYGIRPSQIPPQK